MPLIGVHDKNLLEFTSLTKILLKCTIAQTRFSMYMRATLSNKLLFISIIFFIFIFIFGYWNTAFVYMLFSFLSFLFVLLLKHCFCLLVWVDALRPRWLTEVMSGPSVILTTLSLGKPPRGSLQVLSAYSLALTENYSYRIRGRMVIEIFSLSNLQERMCQTRGSIAVPLASYLAATVPSLETRSSHLDKPASPCNEYPLTSHLYKVKLGITGVYIILFYFVFCSKTQIVGTRYNRISEAVLTCTYVRSIFWAKIRKISHFVIWKSPILQSWNIDRLFNSVLWKMGFYLLYEIQWKSSWILIMLAPVAKKTKPDE